MPHPILILLLPLLSGLLIPTLSSRFGEKIAKIGILTHAVSFLLAVFFLYDVSFHPPINIRFFPSALGDDSIFRFGIYIDRLTAVMMVLITGVNSIVHIFSKNDPHQDIGYTRFFTFSHSSPLLFCL